MVNEQDHWSATVHVYLTAIHRYRQFTVTPDGTYRAAETQLWFDESDVGRRMPASTRS